jgi:hypothetical protein
MSSNLLNSGGFLVVLQQQTRRLIWTKGWRRPETNWFVFWCFQFLTSLTVKTTSSADAKRHCVFDFSLIFVLFFAHTTNASGSEPWAFHSVTHKELESFTSEWQEGLHGSKTIDRSWMGAERSVSRSVHLPPGKETAVPTEKNAWWVPQKVCLLRTRDKFPVSVGNRTTIPLTCNP